MPQKMCDADLYGQAVKLVGGNIRAYADLPGSADELAGRHVHKGRTVAVATCCTALEES